MNSDRTRSYVVDNEEILPLVNAWKAAGISDRNILAGRIVSRLGFLVHSRIRGHKELALYDDLLQEGRIAILRALEDFRMERGQNFFMFANWHIRTRVRRFLEREMRRREKLVGEFAEAPGDETSPQIPVQERESREAIMRALDFLPDHDRKVIIMRFGFDGQEPRTFRQIGSILGITRQRVQQIETAALQRLRRNRKLLDSIGA